MKHITTLFLFLTFCIFSNAQNNFEAETKNMVEDGKKMANHFLKKEYDQFANYMNPNIIKYTGGINNFKKIITTSLPEEFEIIKAEIENPGQIVVEGNDLQSTLVQTIVIKNHEYQIITKSTLFAISFDKGKTWKFADISNSTKEKIKLIVPNLSPKIVIPKKESPVFLELDEE